MRHLPIETYLPIPHRRHVPRSVCRRGPSRHVIHQTLCQDPALGDKLRINVRQLLLAYDKGCGLDPAEVVNSALMQGWSDVAGSVDRPVQTTSFVPAPTTQLIKEMWSLRDSVRKLRRGQISSCFLGWRQVLTLQRLQKELHRRCRANKKDKVEAQLADAEASGGPAGIYRAVRKLAPKSRRVRVQLRDESGALMTPSAELQTIQDYFTSIYGRSPTIPPTVGSMCQFTEGDVLMALRKLHPRKALPPNSAPATLWRTCAEDIAPILHSGLDASLRNECPGLPDGWHDVAVCLIPKTPVVKMPKQLRPICLLHPGSKIVATMLADKLRGRIEVFMKCIPQFAYLPQRSAADALARVCSHLHQARQLAAHANPTLHDKSQGHKTQSLRGGVALSLDINKAFDSLPRSYLLKSLRRAQIAEADICLIMHVHDAARMVYQVGDNQARVNLNQGVRQGCSLSPLLWTLATGSIYLDLVQNLHREQLPLGEPTLYADDVFAAWTINRLSDLTKAIRAMGVLVETLEQSGLQLSLEKTVALLVLKGGAAQSQQSTVCCAVKEGQKALKVRVFQRRLRIMIKHEHVYLGAKISYRNFELCNLQYRMQVAWGTFWRLHTVLRCRSLALHTKVRLWKICVFSALRYSLSSVGPPTQGRAMVTTMVNKQLRMILKSPAHLKHTTAIQVRQACKVEDPRTLLQTDFHNRHSQPYRFLTEHLQIWTGQIEHAYAQVPHYSQSGSKQELALLHPVNSVHHFREISCPVCGVEFVSLYAMKAHITKSHIRHRETQQLDPVQGLILDMCAEVTQRTDVRTFFPPQLAEADSHTRFAYMHARGGMATCNHCTRPCKSWQDLEVHITSRSCRVLFPDGLTTQVPTHNPNQLPLAFNPELLDPFRRSWEVGAEWIAKQGGKWLHNCPWCTQWLADAKAMHIHISAKHPWLETCFAAAKLWLFQQRKLLVLSSPCYYCCKVFRGHPSLHTTACKSLLFARMLWAQCCSQSMSAQDHVDQPGRAASEGPGRGHAGTPDAAGLGEMDSTDTGLENGDRPTKWQKDQTKGPDGKGKGWNNRGQASRRQRQSQGEASSNGSELSKETAQQLIKLLLRHEDQIATFKQSTAWVLFLSPEKPVEVIEKLLTTASNWREQKLRQPASLTLPMRAVLFQATWLELKTRGEKLRENAEAKQTAIDMGLCDANKGFPYQIWDPKEKQTKLDSSKDPLPLDKVMEMAVELMTLAAGPGVITRYHCTRPLSEEMRGNMTTWMLEIGLRNPRCQRVWEILEIMKGNACLKLIGGSIREERMQRSPLAQVISQHLTRHSTA